MSKFIIVTLNKDNGKNLAIHKDLVKLIEESPYNKSKIHFMATPNSKEILTQSITQSMEEVLKLLEGPSTKIT